MFGCFSIFSSLISRSISFTVAGEEPFITFTANSRSLASHARYTTEKPPSASFFYPSLHHSILTFARYSFPSNTKVRFSLYSSPNKDVKLPHSDEPIFTRLSAPSMSHSARAPVLRTFSCTLSDTLIWNILPKSSRILSTVELTFFDVALEFQESSFFSSQKEPPSSFSCDVLSDTQSKSSSAASTCRRSCCFGVAEAPKKSSSSFSSSFSSTSSASACASACCLRRLERARPLVERIAKASYL